MKIKSKIKKLQNLLSSDKRARKAHKDDIKKLLMKLKHKEKTLLKRTLTEFDKNKLARLHKEIEMIHAQRMKGIKALKELK